MKPDTEKKTKKNQNKKCWKVKKISLNFLIELIYFEQANQITQRDDERQRKEGQRA